MLLSNDEYLPHEVYFQRLHGFGCLSPGAFCCDARVWVANSGCACLGRRCVDRHRQLLSIFERRLACVARPWTRVMEQTHAWG